MAKPQENLLNITLYELTGRYAEAAETLEDLDLPEEAVRDALEDLETEISVKAQNIGAFILNLEAEANKIETAEKRLADKRRALKNRAKCTITEVSVDKIALREDLKIREVPGTRLEVGERLEVK